MMEDIEDLILLFGMLAILQLKPGARGEYLIILLIWATIIQTFLALPPSRWVLLQGNEDVGDFILLSLCFLYIKRIKRQGEHKIPNTDGVKLLHRFSFSYRNLLDRIAFRILSNINNDGAPLQKYVEHLQMIGIMVVMLMVFYTCGELVLRGVGPILRNGYEI